MHDGEKLIDVSAFGPNATVYSIVITTARSASPEAQAFDLKLQLAGDLVSPTLLLPHESVTRQTFSASIEDAKESHVNFLPGSVETFWCICVDHKCIGPNYLSQESARSIRHCFLLLDIGLDMHTRIVCACVHV